MKKTILIICLAILSGCATMDKVKAKVLVYSEETGKYMPSDKMQGKVDKAGGKLGAFGVPYVGAAGGVYGALVTGWAYYLNGKAKKVKVETEIDS
jgi:hypothetical protein